MVISAGTRLGPYEILAPLGAGGMGEVWRGRDTRLDRGVAVKVLPAALAADPELRLRFEREARAISSLADPHICTLYDVGHENGVDYIVMELVDGESLSDRLAKGPLPVDQVLRLGIEIADALDKAHRQGIVHRDLKPGNIMLTKSGTKLLDFGLAKIIGEQPVVQLSHMHTAQRQLTAEGTIVGTFQYMAPEQLDGAEADARTDIFAFGAVLYEMATGRRAFEGKTKSSLIAAIVDREPAPISSFQPMTPPAFERVVKSCLAKDPDDRWQSARDIANELRWIQEAGSGAGMAAPVVHRRKLRERTAWAIVIALAAATAVLAYLWHRAAAVTPRRIEASILPPESTDFVFGASIPALSPDGTLMTFPARGSDGKILLWVRNIADGSAHALPGTESAYAPFWSYDSRSIGFFSSGKVRRIDPAGGPPQTICDATVLRGAAWGPSGIVFAPNDRSPLYFVSPAGGTATPVTELDTHEYSHRSPWFLPDGDHFLYLSASFGPTQDRGRIYVGSLKSKERKLVLAANSPVQYSPTGHLLYCRDRTLVAHPFDEKRLAVHGEPVVVADDIYNIGIGAIPAFSVSQNGLLSYFTGAGLLSQFFWHDRSGKVLGTAGAPGEYQRPQISHDGRRIAFEISDTSGNSDIWIYDNVRQTSTRFTFGPGSNGNAIWSHDDRFIMYASEQLDRGTREIVRKSASGLGNTELVTGTTAPFLSLTDWSPDDRYLLFHWIEAHSKTSLDIGYLSLPDRKISLAVQTSSADCCARLSPDGRWMAYASAMSGRNEVYVQPFPNANGRFQISTNGGTQARWSADGKEIFYASPDSKIMAVDVHLNDTFEAGLPKALFSYRQKPGGWPFDVSRDGRFLVNEVAHAEMTRPVTLVVNWNAR